MAAEIIQKNLDKNQSLQRYNKKKKTHLLASITLDLLGMATYLVPLLGETADFVFAPIYGIAIFVMYRRKIFSATLGGIIGFIEEIFTGTDFIPTATLMWVYTYVFKKNSSYKEFIKKQT